MNSREIIAGNWKRQIEWASLHNLRRITGRIFRFIRGNVFRIIRGNVSRWIFFEIIHENIPANHARMYPFASYKKISFGLYEKISPESYVQISRTWKYLLGYPRNGSCGMKSFEFLLSYCAWQYCSWNMVGSASAVEMQGIKLNGVVSQEIT